MFFIKKYIEFLKYDRKFLHLIRTDKQYDETLPRGYIDPFKNGN